MRVVVPISVLAAAIALVACGGDDVPPVVPPGADTSPRTSALKAGATVLQGSRPASRLDVHVVGFHPMYDDPTHQMEAHHFCRQVNEEFAQCVLFDGDGPEANLTGVEYIVSERIFGTLPDDERAYWHPHNGEILSGQLIAPGLPDAAETELMRTKINSYGKTWHTWHTRHGTAAGDALPLGPAALAWSFSRDGEVDPALVASRDARLGVDTARTRAARQGLRGLARPQSGVDTLRDAFPDAVLIPGVVDADAD